MTSMDRPFDLPPSQCGVAFFGSRENGKCRRPFLSPDLGLEHSAGSWASATRGNRVRSPPLPRRLGQTVLRTEQWSSFDAAGYGCQWFQKPIVRLLFPQVQTSVLVSTSSEVMRRALVHAKPWLRSDWCGSLDPNLETPAEQRKR